MATLELDWEMERWLAEEAAPGVPLNAPFWIGNLNTPSKTHTNKKPGNIATTHQNKHGKNQSKTHEKKRKNNTKHFYHLFFPKHMASKVEHTRSSVVFYPLGIAALSGPRALERGLQWWDSGTTWTVRSRCLVMCHHLDHILLKAYHVNPCDIGWTCHACCKRVIVVLLPGLGCAPWRIAKVPMGPDGSFYLRESITYHE